MTKIEEIIEKVDCDKLLYGNKTAKLIIEQCMEEYGKEFARFLLQNAMFQQRGKLYLKFTDKEIKQIIDNAMKDFENGSTEG